MNPDNVDPMTIWVKPTNRSRVAKRRVKNRVARASRRVNRLRGAA